MPLNRSRADYRALLAEADALYPGVRVGRPVTARTYFPLIAGMRVLRGRWRVRTQGAEHVAPGPAILIGNHVHNMDPVMVVISEWWRCSAFTKLEAFTTRGGVFFRFMGQIPLRRGDVTSTDWSMRMAQYTLSRGGKIAIYPEGTRSPDPTQLHKLHKRMLIPLLQDNPDIPVHVVGIRYEHPGGARRIRVDIRVSERLTLDPAAMTADELVTIVRNSMLELGGQTYVDRYAQDVKAERRASAS